MKRIRTSKPVGLPRFIYALIVCALIVATFGVGSGIAADQNAKVTLVYEHALPNVPGKSIKGLAGRIWSRRDVIGPHASQVCFHLRNRSRRSHPKFGQ